MKNPKKESNSKIKKAREKRDWTQEYLASIVDCSRGHLNRVENNDEDLSLKLAKKLAYALGLEVGEI